MGDGFNNVWGFPCTHLGLHLKLLRPVTWPGLSSNGTFLMGDLGTCPGKCGGKDQGDLGGVDKIGNLRCLKNTANGDVFQQKLEVNSHCDFQ